MTWEEHIKKDFRDRMGARLSTYNNSPKTIEIRKKLKELRKQMLDAFDSAGNNTDLEEYEQMLPKITALIGEMKTTNTRQLNASSSKLRRE